jgi:hypothetical protein
VDHVSPRPGRKISRKEHFIGFRSKL